MHLKCPLSNISYQAQGFGKRKAISPHPIFSLSTASLLELYSKDYVKHTLEDHENALLFLALLSKTNCIEFRVPATPSRLTILKNMDTLVRVIDWVKEEKNNKALPKFAVTKEDHSLINVHIYLEMWYKAKISQFDIAEQTRERSKYLVKLDFLKNRIKISDGDTATIKRRLKEVSKLIIDNLPEVSKEQKIEWKRLFTLKEPSEEFYNYPQEQLTALILKLADILVDTPEFEFAKFLSKHVKILGDMITKGMYWRILDDEPEEDEVLAQKLQRYDENSKPFKLLSKHEKNLKDVAESFGYDYSLPMPDVRDIVGHGGKDLYQRQFHYSQAVAKWNLLQEYGKIVESQQAEQEEFLNAPAVEMVESQDLESLIDPDFDSESLLDSDNEDEDEDEDAKTMTELLLAMDKMSDPAINSLANNDEEVEKDDDF